MSTFRRTGVVLLLAAAFAAATGGAAAGTARTNVLFLIVDDLTAALGCHGDRDARTPHMDALAARGVRFDQAFTQFALCNPSRASFLTGCYPERTKVFDLTTSFRDALPDAVTLPQLFKNAGYVAGRVGKVFHVPDPKTKLDVELGAALHKDGAILDEAKLAEASEGDLSDPPRKSGREGNQYNRCYAASARPDRDFTDYDIADNAIATLEQFKDQPFFLAVGFIRPHTPYVAPRAFFDLIDPKALAMPVFYGPGGEDVSLIPKSALRPNNNVFRFAAPSPTEAREARRAYLASTAFVDAQVGRVLAKLDELKLADRTVVLLTGDHGYQLGEHGLWAKQTLFEEGTRVPMLVAAPGVTPGVCSQLVEQVDIYPTLAGLAGLDVPSHVQGRSMQPFLADPAAAGRPAAFSTMVSTHTKLVGRAVRTDRFRYIEWDEGRAGRQLYDHASDPHELRNLAAEPAQTGRVDQLRARLAAHVAERSAAAPPVPVRRPNLLLIVADDLGYGDVGVQGCRDFATPHLDSIAKEGMRFTAGYVPAPVCGPSRAGLMTGRHPCRILPFHGNPPPGSDAGLPLDHRTIADRLKAAGYRTAALGKWHLGESAAHHPMSRGFDEFFGFLSGMHSYVNAEDPKWGPLLRGREKAELRDYLTFALADEACALIRRPSPDPFFLYLAFNAPHIPMEAPAEHLARTAHIADPMRRTNAAMVVALDDAVGRVMAALRESGREADTLVVFLSDNGAALIPGSAPNGGSNTPLRGSKAQLWEGGIRVPFFVRWPGHIAAGGTSDAPVSALDLMPTLLAATGAPAPADAGLDGVNLLPWLEGRAKAPDRGRMFWKFGASQFAVRDGDMKLVRVNDDRGLFNVRTDIVEAADRAGMRPVLARQLETAWKEWDAANLAPAPKAKPAARPATGDAPATPPAAPAPQDSPRQAGAIGIVKDGGAWWFAAPGGARFLSLGMNHIEPVYWQSPNNTQFVGQTYGPDLFRPDGAFNDGSAAAAEWAGRAAANLKSWGFNTLGMHNPPLASLRSADVACYVVELDLHVPWGWNMKRAELVRAFARRPMDVFADAFVAEARSVAARCVKPVAGDPRVLGYAYSDGPPWTIDDDAPGGAKPHPWVLAIMALPAEAPGKQAWLAMMKERYPSAAAAGAVYGRALATWEDLASTTAWDAGPDMPAALADSRAFLERIMRRWYGVLRDAIRDHDPHHLILGDKLNANRDARHPAERAWSLGVVKDYADVIFIQYYAPVEEQRATLAAIHETTRKPVLIGDSACRPLWKDCGLDDAGYYGEMGRVYADHVTGLFSLPYVVGWHHCGYMRGLRRPYVEALKRGDRTVIEEHEKRKMTLREGFISEREEPIGLILKPLSEAIASCEKVHGRKP